MVDQEQISRLQETIDADERAFQSMDPDPMEKLPTDAGLLLAGNACKKAVETLLNTNDGNDIKDAYREEYNYVTESFVGFLGPLVELHIINEEQFKLLLDYFTVHMADIWYLHQLQKG